MSLVKGLAPLSPQTKKSTRVFSEAGRTGTTAPLLKDEESGLIVRRIAEKGTASDLILKVKDASADTHRLYLVNQKLLCDASPYFATLLDPAKFAEGIRVGEKKSESMKAYTKDGSMPLAYLPTITIEDIGQLPAKASTEAVFTFFLCILHKLVLSWSQLDWSSLAMLAVIADRFDAAEIVANYIGRRGWTKRPYSWDERTSLSFKDEKTVRQQILVGLVFGIGSLLQKQTATLIVADSVLWTRDEAPANVDLNGLWWNLPRGLEGMLTALPPGKRYSRD